MEHTCERRYQTRVSLCCNVFLLYEYDASVCANRAALNCTRTSVEWHAPLSSADDVDGWIMDESNHIVQSIMTSSTIHNLNIAPRVCVRVPIANAQRDNETHTHTKRHSAFVARACRHVVRSERRGVHRFPKTTRATSDAFDNALGVHVRAMREETTHDASRLTRVCVCGGVGGGGDDNGAGVDVCILAGGARRDGCRNTIFGNTPIDD